MHDKIKELTLLLLYLTSKDDYDYYYDEDLNRDSLKNSSKSYSGKVLDSLTINGYLYPMKIKKNFVLITKEGEKYAKVLEKKYFK